MAGQSGRREDTHGTGLWLGALCVTGAAMFLLALAGAASAAPERASLTGIETVPLMDGMREDYAFSAPVKRPGERVARATLSGWPSPLELMDFYASALPGKGWRLVRLQHEGAKGGAVPMMILENGSHVAMYQTEHEVMTLSAARSGRRTYLSVEIWAKDAEAGVAEELKLLSEVHRN